MNPNDNQNQTIPVDNTPQDGVNSIASKEEIPLSIEKVEEEEKPDLPIAETQPVTSIFSQNLNVKPSQTEIGETKPDENKVEGVSIAEPTKIDSSQDTKDLYNFQTNAINTNANVNINDFMINEEKNTSLPEISNLESTSVSSETSSISNNAPLGLPTAETTSSTGPVIESTTEPTPTQIPTPNQPGSNSTIIIAVLGVVIAIGLVAGAYFVFIRKPSEGSQNNYVAENFKTEKIVVSQKTEIKTLTIDEYKTTVKSYIERYNNNVRNSKVKLATQNLTENQKLEVYIEYSSELLDIYTELQNLKVPETFKDSHDKLTLSLYALNSLYDTLVLDIRNKTLTPVIEKQIIDSIGKAEQTAANSFNEIANSQ